MFLFSSKKPRYRLSIRRKIILSLVGMVLLSSIIIGIVSLRTFKQNIESHVSSHLISVSVLQKNRIQSFLKHSKEKIELVSSRTQLRLTLRNQLKEPCNENIEKMQRILTDAKNSTADFMNISITGIDDAVIASTNLDLTGGLDTRQDLRTYFQNKQQTSNNDLHLSPDNILSLHMHSPLVLKGEVLGTINVDMNVSELAKITSDYAGLGDSGETILADKHSNGEARFLTPLRFDQGATLKRTIAANRTDTPIIRALQGESGFHSDIVDYRDVPVLAVTTNIPETNWGLLIKIDQSEAYHLYNDLQNKVLVFSCLFLTLSISGAYFLSRSISRPIEHLTDKAKFIQKERIQLYPEIEENYDEETALLAQSFDDMAHELLLNEQLLEATGETANVGGWEVDVETQEVRWTKQLFHIHELPQGQQPKTLQQALEFFPIGDRERVIKSVKHCIETGESYDIQVRFLTAKGRELWTRAIGHPKLENGKVVKIQGTLQDITKQKMMVLELEEARKDAEIANRAKSEFLTSMSHELRTPLNAVLGFAQMLQFDPKASLSPTQNEYVQSIIEGGTHLLQLVSEILDLARIEADKVDLSLKDVEANSVIVDCVSLISPLGKQRNITIIDQFSAGPPTLLYTDQTRLKQILINLLSNAIKFNKVGGTVTLEGYETENGYLRISVTDTGVGIAKENYSSVFHLFHRLNSDPMIAREGTGIGLTVTKLLVDRMAGRVGFESEIETGSTFWIELPLASNEDILIWTNTMSTGVDTIDKDHQVLISMLNRIMRRSIANADVDNLIGELINYTRYHFQREEVIMEVCGYPDLEKHRNLHQDLLVNVKSHSKSWQNHRNQEELNHLRHFLKGWLFNHILQEDARIRPYTQGKDQHIQMAFDSLGLN